jgi:transcriptional regulator with XRE-family HTH domain
MTSSSLRLDPRRRTYVRLLGEVRHALRQALSEEYKTRGLTQDGIASVLGKSKSVISRKLAGTSNMTLETLADLAYALDRPVKVSVPSRVPNVGVNATIVNPGASSEMVPQKGRIVATAA